jgi:hypothetical protein
MACFYVLLLLSLCSLTFIQGAAEVLTCETNLKEYEGLQQCDTILESAKKMAL